MVRQSYNKIIFFLLICGSLNASKYIQVPITSHVHSTFSSGEETIEELVKQARNTNLKAIILSDHDNISAEFGIEPFPHVLKYKKSMKSLLNGNGNVERYLEQINRINEQYKDFILIPGAETAPFYYWSGSLTSGDLTLNDWRRHLIIVGLEKAEDYYGLPVVGGRLKTRYVSEKLLVFVVFAMAFLFSITLMMSKGAFRKTGVLLTAMSLLGIINNHPFKSSKFSQYKGYQGEEPYQEVINYVNQRGGMIFWAHPESNRIKESMQAMSSFPMFKVDMKTNKYPSVLSTTYGYTGFEALYGDTISITKPGMEWDQTLLEYIRLERENAPWGIIGLDYHKFKQNSWSRLDIGQTVLLVPKFSKTELLNALKDGRSYSVYNGGDGHVIFNFNAHAENSPNSFTFGEKIDTAASEGKSVLELEIKLDNDDKELFNVDIIRTGKIFKSFQCTTPCKSTFKDQQSPSEQGYYRVSAKSQKYEIVSNPVFFIYR